MTIVHAETGVAYRQLRDAAARTDDQDLYGLCEQRERIEARIVEAHERIERLRRQHEEARQGISRRTALEALSGAESADTEADDMRAVATAQHRIEVAERALAGLLIALDQHERKIEEHVASVASDRRDMLARHAQEQIDYAAALEAKAVNARRDADATRLLMYAMQPGNTGARATIEGGVTAERREPYRGGQGFEDLELPTEELFGVAGSLPGGRLTPSEAAHRRAEAIVSLEPEPEPVSA